MNVLVTGGAGFIGSTLVDRLVNDGHNVDVIDDLSTGSLRNLAEARAQRTGTLKFHQCDIRDDGVDRLIERRSPDVVYHLATTTSRGQRRPATSDAAAVDVVGTLRILEAAAAAGARKVVLAGRARSAAAPGLAAVAERALVRMVIDARDALGIETTVLELATTYGPRQRPGLESSVVATFAHRLRTGVPCVVHGSGDQTRDFVYVADAVEALVAAASAGDGLVIGVGSGVATPIAELHATMSTIAASGDEAVSGALRHGDVSEVTVDPARAAIYLGWRPFTPLTEGLAETLAAVEVVADREA